MPDPRTRESLLSPLEPPPGDVATGRGDVPPSLLAALTFVWFAFVAYAHYRDFFTHR